MKKVAILYPGDMGNHIATSLINEGFEVYSDLAQRSGGTRQQALEAGVKSMSLEKIAGDVDYVISLVPPDAVKDVAQAYIQAAANAPSAAAFVDMNAKSIDMANELAEQFEQADLRFTNACIIGRAASIQEEGVIYYSGERWDRLEQSLGSVFTMRYLGETVAAATAFKMVFAGFNKAIAAVLFETAIAAQHFGIAESLFEEIHAKLPGTMDDISKTIGNYPQHIGRRQQEMQALSSMLAAQDLPCAMSGAAAATFAEVSARDYFQDLDRQNQTPLKRIIEALQ